VVYMWIIGLGFMSYVIARIVLGAYPHPVHWISGVVGAVKRFWLSQWSFRGFGRLVATAL